MVGETHKKAKKTQVSMILIATLVLTQADQYNNIKVLSSLHYKECKSVKIVKLLRM